MSRLVIPCRTSNPFKSCSKQRSIRAERQVSERRARGVVLRISDFGTHLPPPTSVAYLQCESSYRPNTWDSTRRRCSGTYKRGTGTKGLLRPDCVAFACRLSARAHLVPPRPVYQRGVSFWSKKSNDLGSAIQQYAASNPKDDKPGRT